MTICTHCINKKHGFDRKGRQRLRCCDCGVSWTEGLDSVVNRLPKAVDKRIKELLLAGRSIRDIKRLTGAGSGTILSRRQALLDLNNIHEPRPRSGGCDYCGGRICVRKESDRRTARTKHKFCTHQCYVMFRMWTEPERLANYLYRKVTYGKAKNKR